MTALRRFGLLVPLAAFSLAGCGINSVPTAEEQVNASWANLQADYQRRSDLI
ncbi:MAG: LemA family protein, partial [Bradyrhizobium sp.]|nr:LemA family protein [Bradyrhizobium sp.]